jgi:thymidine phosphorylase
VQVVELIKAKRDGLALDDRSIKELIDGYCRGRVPDEQMSAMLMAVYFNGLDERELTSWMGAMIASGARLDLSGVGRPTVDKHSTGGVGDKISLVLAPLVATCGPAVPQLSGRGLGHTGGTLDKLESIQGFQVDLSPEEMVRVLTEVGCVICGAGPGLAPADGKLYALRDVTGTVESIPLIASSIMSKKIVEGTGALVLDVKVGTGAFMRDLSSARRLAEAMVVLGSAYGVRTSALLTRMDTPLGWATGNALEVAESIETLSGMGPPDVVEVTLALAREMLALAGVDADPAAMLRSGAALTAFENMVKAQGGDLTAPLPQAPHVESVLAEGSGHLVRLDALAVGTAAWRLGAGRARKEDPVSAAAGVICLKKPGEPVENGEPVLELHADDADRLAAARDALRGAVQIGPDRPDVPPLVIEVIRE